jgi:hypothetical protein
MSADFIRFASRGEKKHGLTRIKGGLGRIRILHGGRLSSFQEHSDAAHESKSIGGFVSPANTLLDRQSSFLPIRSELEV